MEQRLEDLISGKLLGVKRLKLACGLTEFPEEIISLADTLEILDLSDNKFSKIPESISKLKHLKIVFFANNEFTEFPSQLANCPSLSMIGFKANKIEFVPENAFPPLLRWLILTDNKISHLPKSIGGVHLLQKFAIAGNHLEELPNEMANCENLELLRISANKLKSIPDWLFTLPKLSWVAFGGNNCSFKGNSDTSLETFSWNDLDVKEVLGQGASGVISKAKWKSKNKDVAVKVFKGEVTSDGLPEDEMDASIQAGKHENLVPVLAKIENHPEGKSGIIMDLIDSSYYNLGGPPSFDTCTRDVFDETIKYNESQLLKIAKGIASVCCQLHKNGINHGDLYAHNILINKDSHSILGDFGAATWYDTTSEEASLIVKVEVRAFGNLVEDILSQVEGNRSSKWDAFVASCTQADVNNRPDFVSVIEKLNNF